MDTAFMMSGYVAVNGDAPTKAARQWNHKVIADSMAAPNPTFNSPRRFSTL